MSYNKLTPELISKFEQVIDYNIKNMSLLAEIAEKIDDPTLLAIITSIIGDENSHIRLFTLLLLLADNVASPNKP